MNNRIMAMLFALVAAMFISIVPVKAEAAVENHNHAGTWIEAVPATCAKDGMQKYFKCNTCDYKANTANQQVTTAQLVISKSTVAHTYEWDHSETQHFKKCTVEGCGSVLDSSKALHNPDCSPNSNGGHTWSCKDPNCDWTAASEHNLDANCKCQSCDKVVHQLTLVPAKAATCNKDGNVKYYYCTNCSAAFTDAAGTKVLNNSVVQKTGHQWQWVHDETKHYQECTVEGCPAEQNGALHDEHCEVSADGKTHTWTCKDENCSWTITGEEHTDDNDNCSCDYCDVAIEHDLSDWKKDITGHWATCDTCGEKLEFTDHNYGEAKPVEGHTYHVKTCVDCGFERQFDCTSTKDKDCLCDECGTMVKHTTANMELVNRVEPKCEEEGNIGYNKCTTCGRPFSVDGTKCTLYTGKIAIDAVGHEFKEGRNWHENAEGTGHYKVCGNDGCDAHVYITADGVQKGDETHTHGSWYDNKLGKHCEVCAVCGLSYGDEEHDYKTPVQTTVLSGAAKKQQHGLQCECGAVKYEVCTFNADCVCSVCGTAKIHVRNDLDYVARHNPTCTEDGNVGYYPCKTCGKNFEKVDGAFVVYNKNVVLEALGHDWSARPNTLNGQHLQKCARCSAYQTLECQDTTGDCLCDVNNCGTLVHSHNLVFNRRVEATCEADGNEGYYTYQECDKKMFDADMNEITAPVVIPATGHDDTAEWIPGEDGQHVKVCPDCDEVIETAEHDFSAGMICPDCGANESLTRVPAKDATCYEDGNIEYWYAVNGDKFADEDGIRKLEAGEEKIEKIEHVLVWEPMNDGKRHQEVCKNEGCTMQPIIENHSSENGCYCEVCGGYYEGHQLYLEEMVPATCAKAGTQAYYECACGDLFDMGYNKIEAPKTIAKLKHDMDSTVKEDAKEGKHYIQCKDCDYRLYENHGMVMSDPNKGNYHQWLCECGKLEIETHYDKNGDKKCDVCGHSMNSTTETTTVEQHDNKTVYTGQSGTVKPTKDWWWNWQEWFTPSNAGGSETTGEAEDRNISNSGTNSGTTNNGVATNGTTNSGSTNSGNAGSGSANNSGNTNAPTVNTPTASQTGVIAQFITWFLGLFGF